jgi:dTDP-4-amino-4,6-dideoxygalactose transaminase
VKLLDLQAQFGPIRDEVMAAVRDVVESQQFILGPKVVELEETLAAYCGCAHAVGVSSGTDALLVALMALGVGPGDEVVTPAFSFFASAGSIARLGARPVFVDIDPEAYAVAPEKIENAVTERTKAIMPVHLFGQCADMTAVMAIADKHGIPVVEDAAQAIGSEHVGRRAGSFGAFGCFSFFPTKNLGAFGEGGMLTTDDEALADRARLLRHHGDRGRYDHVLVGGNFRLEAIQAAVLLVKLKHLDDWTAKRQANAARYRKLFAEAGLVPERVRLPVERPGRHVYNQFVIEVERRDELCAHLAKHGIGHSIYYPKPLHLQPCFHGLGHKPGDFPVTERACTRVLALPIYPELPDEHLARVAEAVRDFFAT